MRDKIIAGIVVIRETWFLSVEASFNTSFLTVSYSGPAFSNVYKFRVSALNELGSGLPSDASPQYKTRENRHLRAPVNVGGGGGKAGTLTVTWDPLPPQDWNSSSIWYKIYWKLSNEYDYDYQTKELNQIQAINRMGEGPVSEPKEVHSAESMPQVQPSLVTAFPFNSTGLNVSWAPLEYWRTGQALTLLHRGTHNHGLIVALSPHTEYSFSVMAYNEADSGPESEPAIPVNLMNISRPMPYKNDTITMQNYGAENMNLATKETI
uniref:Fibronectin type-III domain-containing protein n=1 Tax=Tetranychus urticae TaxID=32264 RepID=T1JZ64_TETUR